MHELADTATPLRATRLSGLTRLTDEERQELASAWPALPVERRRQVIEQLGVMAEDNVELDFDAVFIEALQDDDPAVRAGAIQSLWEHTERDVIPHLVRMVREDPAVLVRMEAATALGRFVLLGEFEEARPRDVETVTDTLRAVIADPAEALDVRARAVEAVGASSRPWARDIIHDAYDAGNERMAIAALRAMGRSADSYWLPTVLDELHSPNPEMRYEAAAACGSIDDEEALAYLAELFEDEDSEVQEQAITAVGEIGGEEAIVLLRRQAEVGDERTREAARAALEEAEFGDDPLGFTR
jgi:HEAT repeat protein